MVPLLPIHQLVAAVWVVLVTEDPPIGREVMAEGATILILAVVAVVPLDHQQMAAQEEIQLPGLAFV